MCCSCTRYRSPGRNTLTIGAECVRARGCRFHSRASWSVTLTQKFYVNAVPLSGTASVRVTSLQNAIKRDINICKDVYAHLVLSGGPTVSLFASSAPITRKCCSSQYFNLRHWMATFTSARFRFRGRSLPFPWWYRWRQLKRQLRRRWRSWWLVHQTVRFSLLASERFRCAGSVDQS